MLMIIDRHRLSATAFTAMLAWVALLALVALLVQPTPTVLVLGPRAPTLRAADATGAAIIDLGMTATRLRSDKPGFVRALYAAGAWLVLPAPEGGCFGNPAVTSSAVTSSRSTAG